MATAVLQTRVDSRIKEEADTLFDSFVLGISLLEVVIEKPREDTGTHSDSFGK